MFYGLVLEGGSCLSPKSFSSLSQLRQRNRRLPQPPQAPSIRISCSPTSSIHHSQTGRGRRKETPIAYNLKWSFPLKFLQFWQKLNKDDTSCGEMSFFWLKTKMTGPDFLSTFFSQLFSLPPFFLVTKWKWYLSFADKLQTKHGEKMLTPSW